MAKKSKVLLKFESMGRCMRRVRQPVYKGLNFLLSDPDNDVNGSLCLYFIQDGKHVVSFEFYVDGRHLKCVRTLDNLEPEQFKVSQRVYKLFEKFHKIFIELGGKV